MARIARVVVPKVPHHIIQRGNRRQPVFFGKADYQEYLALMAEWCRAYRVQIWAYCLMPNHVHLIAVPPSEESLKAAIGEAHRRYSRNVNVRQGWSGHLWQGRFSSYPMDESYLLRAARYIELNPVTAKLVKDPGKYSWSSAKAHLQGVDDLLVRSKPLLSRIDSWKQFLREQLSGEDLQELRQHERTGRPLGNSAFIRRVEKNTGRDFSLKKPGPKKTTR